jgi:hypothetical protein
MKRRTFITLLGGAAAWPLAARAQQARKVYRIGFLWDSPAVQADSIEAFRRGLRELGWIDGQNIAIEYRWAEGRPERMRELAEELVRLKVDIIVAPSSIYTEAAKRATSTIPIIFMTHAAPIESGHVISLARPGGECHRAGLNAAGDKRQSSGTADGGPSKGFARCCHLGPCNTIAWTGSAGGRDGGSSPEASASSFGRARRFGIRRRIREH